MLNRPSILVIGYGNPGRLDDGLGPALAARLEAQNLPGVTVDSDYQLTVEDACEVSRYGVVVFADAHVDGPEPFTFTRLTATAAPGFSSHGVEPEEVLGLAAELFETRPRAYVLAIRGYEFDGFGERLSPGAENNLRRALTFIGNVIEKDLFEDAAGAYAAPGNGEHAPCAAGADTPTRREAC
jgi:hydrogenase maturation protease